MSTEDHLISPPDELLEDWWQETQKVKPERWVRYLADRAAHWGYEQGRAIGETELQKARDEELDACCDGIRSVYGEYQADWLRSVRRPKPPSQAEEALKALDSVASDLRRIGEEYSYDTIYAALERLRELEEGNE